jgi:hypothetical protein
VRAWVALIPEMNPGQQWNECIKLMQVIQHAEEVFHEAGHHEEQKWLLKESSGPSFKKLAGVLVQQLQVIQEIHASAQEAQTPLLRSDCDILSQLAAVLFQVMPPTARDRYAKERSR